MERSQDNPNEALTAMYVGEELMFVPLIDYYTYRDNPEAAIAHLAIKKASEDEK